jgi:hypothetical protein
VVQQTPSTQNPDMHCDGVEHGAPLPAGDGVVVGVTVGVAGGGGPHMPIGVLLQTPPAVNTPPVSGQVMKRLPPPFRHSAPRWQQPISFDGGPQTPIGVLLQTPPAVKRLQSAGRS